MTVFFLLSGSLSAYFVHLKLSQVAARENARALQVSRATGAALGTGAVLFVPDYGNVCRRRWLDNTTGTMRDGGQIPCDEAVSWNATVPSREKKFERRMDAIRNVFQSKSIGSVE